MKYCFFILVVLLTGCSADMFLSPVGSIAGNLVGMWVQGEGHKYYNYDVETICRDTKHSLEILGHPITKNEKTKTGYHIEAGYMKGAFKRSKFSINISEIQKNTTEVSIRVNIMGDIPYGDLIFRNIDDQLNIIDFNEQGVPVRKRNDF